jgi:hypothetical protein
VYVVKLRACDYLATKTRDLKRDPVILLKIMRFLGFTKEIHMRLCKTKSKVQHIIFFISRIFQFVVVVYILKRAFWSNYVAAV